jgi:hypothetical protein
MNKWTEEDQKLAREEGWGLFFMSDIADHFIQRDHANSKFLSDEDAIKYVFERAKEGGIYKKAARIYAAWVIIGKPIDVITLNKRFYDW